MIRALRAESRRFEKENPSADGLKRLVPDLSLEKQVLRDVAQGNY